MRALADYQAPAWATNYIRAGRLEPGERVLVVVDEPLAEDGAALAAAVLEAGGRPELQLWTGERPFSEPPPPVAAAAEEADLCIFIAQEPRSDEAGARIRLNDILVAHGGRELYSGLVDSALLRDEMSKPSPDLEAAARSVLDQLDGKQTVRVRGRAGTDLTFGIGDREWHTDAAPIQAG
jgi:hypothetical protein